MFQKTFRQQDFRFHLIRTLSFFHRKKVIVKKVEGPIK